MIELLFPCDGLDDIRIYDITDMIVYNNLNILLEKVYHTYKRDDLTDITKITFQSIKDHMDIHEILYGRQKLT